MKTRTLFTGFLLGVLGLFSCGDNKTTTQTTLNATTEMQTIDLNNLLYTTPTINDALPDFVEKTDTCAFFHEDEWRQVEFISKNQRELIDKEVEKIKDIVENQSVKGESQVGYKSVAVRDLITQPLSVEFSKLTSYLTTKPIMLHGLGFDNNPGQVKGGFYFNLNGVNYYGVLDNNQVKVLGIYSAESEQDLKTATGKLSELLAEEKLYLVDWRAMRVFDETNIKTELVK
ncbi:hypothetical protein [Polluticoccus soli]|uniref:hypothetical protein n=1 Tax=Polluticoccus soli TaxID=3034150 RepID=UPI0023E2A842|nr:hypothetical protein [Flavipsychrobacter sp. JY13-12]